MTVQPKIPKKKFLNLDEIFGEVETPKVKFGGVEYELRTVESLTSTEYASWERLGKKLAKYQQVSDDELSTEEYAKLIDGVVDQTLSIICPELLKATPPLSFPKKLRVVTFYTTLVQKADEGNPADAKSGTGEAGEPKN